MHVDPNGFHVNDSEATFLSISSAHSNVALLKVLSMIVVLLIVAGVIFLYFFYDSLSIQGLGQAYVDAIGSSVVNASFLRNKIHPPT